MNFDEWAKSIFKHGTDAQYGIAKAAWDEAIKTEREEREPEREMVTVTREMAIDAGDPSMEGMRITW